MIQTDRVRGGKEKRVSALQRIPTVTTGRQERPGRRDFPLIQNAGFESIGGRDSRDIPIGGP